MILNYKNKFLYFNKNIFKVLKSFIFISQLVSVNGHLGYNLINWNTQTRMHIWGIRYNYHILNLSKSLYGLRQIFFHLHYLLILRKKILFISENKYIDSYLKKVINSCKQFISTYRWLGGLLTNCRRVLSIIRILKLKRFNILLFKRVLRSNYKFITKFKNKNYKFYKTLFNKRKKNLIVLRKFRRYDHIISGFYKLKGLPHFVVILNGVKSKWAINESLVSGIPSAVFIDSISPLIKNKLHYRVAVNTSSFGVQSLLCGLFRSQIVLSYSKHKLFFKAYKSIRIRSYEKTIRFYLKQNNSFRVNYKLRNQLKVYLKLKLKKRLELKKRLKLKKIKNISNVIT